MILSDRRRRDRQSEIRRTIVKARSLGITKNDVRLVECPRCGAGPGDPKYEKDGICWWINPENSRKSYEYRYHYERWAIAITKVTSDRARALIARRGRS